MNSFATAPIRTAGFSAAAALLLSGGLLVLGSASPVHAQGAAGCTDIQKHLLERKSIVERLQKFGKGRPDPRAVCAQFTKLVNNGAVVLKWVAANKDWCQIPDSFANGLKEDNGKAQALRTKACGVAAKQAEIEKKAREGGNSGLLGGPGLEGSYKMPQGAL